MAFPPLPDLTADELERRQLALWKEEGLFRRTLEANREGPPFVFYEGPPTANGRPGIHHVFARTIKDLVCRFHAMEGKSVTRIAGWDTHGLPVEIEVEKDLQLNGKKAIEAFGVREFNARARQSVFKYQEEWESLSDRIAYWLDYDHPYITCNNDYVESVWWLLGRLHQRDLLYRGHRVLPYCPRCGTVLSSHELAQGYEEVTTNSIYLTFPVDDGSGRELLVWTTTPWTLLSNVAVAVNPDLMYGEYQVGDRIYVLATARSGLPSSSEKGAPSFSDVGPLRTFPGRELVGLRYRRPLDVVPLPEDRASRVVVAGRLRHRGRRQWPGPPGARLRRRRLPGGQRPRARAGEAGGTGRHVHRDQLARDRGPPGHRQGDQRPDHRAAQARRPLAPDPALHPQLSPLLALLQPADLLRPRLLVRADLRGEAADAGDQS